MNILYINHYAGSIHHGMEYRPYYLAREWVKLGHNVTIVASSYSHLRKKNIKINLIHRYFEEKIDGINYIWCKTPDYQGNGYRRAINIFLFLHRLRALIPKLLKEVKPDLVIASSTYPFDTKTAKAIADKAHAKFIYEIHDLWPLTPIELYGMSRNHPYIYWMQKAEDFGYKNADKVISLLPNVDDYMISRGMDTSKFVYIPNGINLDEWQMKNLSLFEDMANSIEKIRKVFKFIVGYSGSIGESNALDYLIDAAIKSPRIAVILVGDGVNKLQLQKKVMQSGNENIFFFPPIAKSMIPDFLSKMDALYIGWNNIPIYRFGISPNKIFDYMMAKKPILHSITTGNDPVAESNCGLSVPAANVTAITQALEKFSLMSKDELEQLGQNGYDYVMKNHEYKMLAQKFLDVCVNA